MADLTRIDPTDIVEPSEGELGRHLRKLKKTAGPRNAGCVELLTLWGAKGWVLLSAELARTVQVEAVFDGAVIGRAAVNELRLDSNTVHGTDRRFGFVMVFERPLAIDEIPCLQVFHPEGAAVLPKCNVQRCAVEGYVDSVTRQGASGWAWVPSFPGAAVQVEAVLNDRVIGRATAGQMRPDLSRYNVGTGLYGFEVTFDELITGNRAPSLRVSGPGDATRLHGGNELPPLTTSDEYVEELPVSAGLPGAIDSPPPTVEGYVDSVTRQGASGWAWVPSFPGAAIWVEAVLKGRVIGRATADQMRSDLLEHNVGTGRYGFELFFEETIVSDPSLALRLIGPDGSVWLVGTDGTAPTNNVRRICGRAPCVGWSARRNRFTTADRRGLC